MASFESRFLNFHHGPKSGTKTTGVGIPFVFVQRISLQPLVPFLVSELLPFLFPFLFKRCFLSVIRLPFIIRSHWSTKNQSRTTVPMVKLLVIGILNSTCDLVQISFKFFIQLVVGIEQVIIIKVIILIEGVTDIITIIFLYLRKRCRQNVNIVITSHKFMRRTSDDFRRFRRAGVRFPLVG